MFGFINDADRAAFNFVVNQTAVVRGTIGQKIYPDLNYGELVYVDTSAPTYASSIVEYTSDTVGKARWYDDAAKDVPRADATFDKSEVSVYTAAVGYGYTEDEVMQASASPGMNLNTRKAEAARRASQEFIWQVALTGDASKGLYGLGNNPAVAAALAPNDGAGAVRTFFNAGGDPTKTPAQICRDLNSQLVGIFVGSVTVEIADTMIVPHNIYAWMAATPMSSTNSETVLTYFLRTNLYTTRTGQPLKLRGELGFETAGAGGTSRIVSYRNQEDVVRLNMPMAHTFAQPWRTGPYSYEVPGKMRLSGVEFSRPGAARYLDGA